jgi:hypothetical protein
MTADTFIYSQLFSAKASPCRLYYLRSLICLYLSLLSISALPRRSLSELSLAMPLPGQCLHFADIIMPLNALLSAADFAILLLISLF